MAYFTKGDLHFQDYDWKAKDEGDNPKITGFPDNVLLARREGYEILSFINKVAKNSNQTEKPFGQKIERLIHDHLPGDIRSHKNVLQWLIDNWAKH